MSGRAVILFMRYPEAGKVKSRLAASVGAAKALRIYRKLVARVLGMLQELLQRRPEVRVFIFYTPREKKAEMEALYPGPWTLVPQEGEHLGHRMARAFEHVRTEGEQDIVIIGSDIPDLDVRDMEEAFDALAKGQAVLGPAVDGGFYLLGLPRPCPAPFEPSSWGTKDVFQRTRELLRRCIPRIHLLPEKQDVDRSEDLPCFQDDPVFTFRLSVIIPTLSSPEFLAPSVNALAAQLWPGDEIVVVQGTDSLDCAVKEKPRPVASWLVRLYEVHVRWAMSPRGRGLQMNGGAEMARGDLFWFLHDDCTPPANGAYLVHKSARDKEASLGCFQMAFAPSSPLLDWIARWADFRTRHMKLPYGDQGLFCRREIFEKARGFGKPYLMEDVDFVKRCRRLGEIAFLPQTVVTSPRRYLEKGVLKAALQNHLTMALYLLGVDNADLARLYYGRTS